KQALSIDSRYAPARLDLARWYLKHGQTEEAVRELSRVVETPPLTKRWMWEKIHRPEAEDLLQHILAHKKEDHSSILPRNYYGNTLSGYFSYGKIFLNHVQVVSFLKNFPATPYVHFRKDEQCPC